MARVNTAKKFKLEPRDKSSFKEPAVTKVTEDECIIKGEVLTPGREFTVEGGRERYAFRHVVVPEAGLPWIECRCVRSNAARAFYPAKVKKVIPLPRTKKVV